MGFFTLGRRRTSQGSSSSTLVETHAPARGALRFAGVEEALTAEQCPLAACDAVGREMALDGASITEALSGLQEIWQLVEDGPPTFEATSAFVTAWGETVQTAVNSISCEDPLTGMASAAHLRAALAATRSSAAVRRNPRSHALVVIDLDLDPVSAGFGAPSRAVERPLERALRLVRLREQIAMVFATGETVARIAPTRVAVLVERDDHLGRRVALLGRLIEEESRIWIEGLPEQALACELLIDELSRI